MIPKIQSSHGSETRNIINRVIEVLNQHGVRIQDLVAEGQLTPEQYATLIQTINGLISKGDVTFDDIDINKGKLLPKHLSEEVLKMLTGDAPINAVPADGSVTREKMADKAISSSKLADNYDFKKVYSTGDLNTLIVSGVYLVTNEVINKPEGLTSGVLTVKNAGNFVKQEIANVSVSSSKGEVYSRVILPNAQVFNPWGKINNEPIAYKSLEATVLKDSTITNTQLSNTFSYRGALNTSRDLNEVLSTGIYTLSGTNPNAPSGISLGILEVASTGNFCVQKLYSLHGSMKDIYYRTVLPNSEIYGTWSKIGSNDEGGGTSPDSPLAGKTIVQFGDSIFGNKRPPRDISTAVSQRTGATVHNIGFGGSTMTPNMNYWDAVSMYRLADAVATGDYSMQDQMISAYDDGSFPNMPPYFKEVVSLLKSINFEEVDIITIAHGTNDYTIEAILNNPEDDIDTNSFSGALRYTLRTISTAYPHIKIVVISPHYRFYTESSPPYDFIEDSDTKVIGNNKLTDFVEISREVSKEEKTLFFDAYYTFGINKYNRHYYFDDLEGRGGTHHSDAGARYIGHKIGALLLSNF